MKHLPPKQICMQNLDEMIHNFGANTSLLRYLGKYDVQFFFIKSFHLQNVGGFTYVLVNWSIMVGNGRQLDGNTLNSQNPKIAYKSPKTIFDMKHHLNGIAYKIWDELIYIFGVGTTYALSCCRQSLHQVIWTHIPEA